jgi:hypothetical protein
MLLLLQLHLQLLNFQLMVESEKLKRHKSEEHVVEEKGQVSFMRLRLLLTAKPTCCSSIDLDLNNSLAGIRKCGSTPAVSLAFSHP